MKIALIAMSGIRACDDELLQLGLTLPGFVERSKTIASLPSLGLLTLAAMTDKYHHITYLEVPDLSLAGNLPDDFDLVAISSYSAQIDEAYHIAKQYQRKSIQVVIGGPHVTALPKEASQHCDAVVIGEGEAVWPQVLNDAEKQQLQSFYGQRNSNYDLADSPVPAYELLDIANYNRLTVQTSRGCPHQCEFCASSVILTNQYKQKPIAHVLAEIDRILEIWPRPFIEFADDNAFVNKHYWHELLSHLKDKNLKWFAETDLSIAEDEPLLDLMRQTGCSQLLLGLESPSRQPLQGLDQRNDWKFKRFPDYQQAIQIIQSHGITVNGCFVLGLDGHTPDVFEQTFDFVKQTHLYEVQVTILTPFPGTPLYHRFEKQNRLLYPNQWQRCTLFDVNFQPADMTAKQLADGFKDLVQKLYSDEFTQSRRDHFKTSLRQTSKRKRRL